MLRPRKPSALLVKTLLFFILAMPLLQGRGKLDVIHLRNGDTVTGEIKSLDRGILSVNTDFMGTIAIEWRGVLRVTSPQTFDVEVGGGARFGGSFPESGQDGVINLDLGGQVVNTLERIDIVRMGPLDKKFWDRIEARGRPGIRCDPGQPQRHLQSNLRNHLSDQERHDLHVLQFVSHQAAETGYSDPK